MGPAECVEIGGYEFVIRGTSCKSPDWSVMKWEQHQICRNVTSSSSPPDNSLLQTEAPRKLRTPNVFYKHVIDLR